MEVNSFWHGGALSPLEMFCLSSYPQNGIDFNLFVYEEPVGLPSSIKLRDAAEIVPRDRLFAYQMDGFNRGSFSGFSNLFRYSLIHQRGGLWVDTDLCCIRPFAIEEESAFFHEANTVGVLTVASCFYQAPAGSPVLAHCLEVFGRKDVSKIVHAETGPMLITEAIRACGKESDVLASDLFLPVPWWEYERLFFDESISLESCFTVHFWNAMITAGKLDKQGTFPAGSVFEQLKAKYLSR